MCVGVGVCVCERERERERKEAANANRPAGELLIGAEQVLVWPTSDRILMK